MDEECLRESGVMLIRANRALIRGSSMLPDGSGPYFLPIGAGCGQASILQTIEGGNQMKRFKERRNMKVYGMSGYNYKSTPTIMLKGQWLKELGFEIGGYVSMTAKAIRAAAGELTAEKLEEILHPAKKPLPARSVSIKIPAEAEEKYFSGMKARERTDLVMKALDAWFAGKEAAYVQQ